MMGVSLDCTVPGSTVLSLVLGCCRAQTSVTHVADVAVGGWLTPSCLSRGAKGTAGTVELSYISRITGTAVVHAQYRSALWSNASVSRRIEILINDSSESINKDSRPAIWVLLVLQSLRSYRSHRRWSLSSHFTQKSLLPLNSDATQLHAAHTGFSSDE